MGLRQLGAPREDARSFAGLLRQARTAAALSQEELAERSGLSVRGVSDLERGIHRAPRLETVRLLAEALALADDERAALIAAARPSQGTLPPTESGFAPLPIPPTRLVGREREVAMLADHLRDEHLRLLTLTGIGGSGKTRLAIAVAGDLGDAFASGVAFVDLTSLSDPSLVPAAVVQALGLKEAPGARPEAILRTFLVDKQLLLLVDNCEHLLAAAPFFARLLGASPGMKVLATSREPLRLRGEREFPVPPLALPDLATAGDLERIGASAAVTFFVDRARDAYWKFRLHEQNARAVAEICRRLDGLPLALELAAARTRVMSSQALLKGLEQPLPLLTTGARDAPARHRTLRDTIAWSFDLLGDHERRLYRTLGCFVGGWTLEAAEAIAGPDRDANVFEILVSLVEKNLVQCDTAGEEPRYSLLETIREFALAQLAASGEERAVRGRHAAWFLTLAKAAEPALEGFGGEQARWLARIDAELGNMRAALGWFHQTGDAQRLLRLATVLDTYWVLRSHHDEVVLWLEAGLRAPRVSAPVRADALSLLVTIWLYQGNVVKAAARADESRIAAETSGDRFKIGRAQFNLGDILLLSGDLERAQAALCEALVLLREEDASSWIHPVLSALGSARLLCGDIEGAVPLLDEALVLVRLTDESDPHALQDHYGLCRVLGARAYAALAQGELSLATSLLSEKYSLARELGVVREVLGALAGFAGVALEREQPARAARWLGAIAATRDAGGSGHLAEFQHVQRLEAATRDALGEDAFATSWQEGQALRLDDVIAEALAFAQDLPGT